MRYPNGKPYIEKNSEIEKKKINLKRRLSSANRGMSLEDDLNSTNEYYKNNNIALIYKRPTPINVVKVDYSKNARIVDAYFEKQSTTDYNGIYRGRYIDFEAKNTKNKNSFPLNNIYKHQIEHLKKVIYHGGIAFFIIEFEFYEKIFLLDAKYIIDFFDKNERKSIPYETILKDGIEIMQGFSPRINYLKAVDKAFF